MKISSQRKSFTDVCQHYTDDAFAFNTLTFTTALAADLQVGDCINPATGALLKTADTACAVVSEFTPAGSKSVVTFNKLVVLKKSALTAHDAAGVAKAITLLTADSFVKLI